MLDVFLVYIQKKGEIRGSWQEQEEKFQSVEMPVGQKFHNTLQIFVQGMQKSNCWVSVHLEAPPSSEKAASGREQVRCNPALLQSQDFGLLFWMWGSE